MLHYLLCQGEGDVSLHSNSKDSLVAIDGRVGDGGQSWVADLQTHASNVHHALRRKTFVKITLQLQVQIGAQHLSYERQATQPKLPNTFYCLKPSVPAYLGM